MRGSSSCTLLQAGAAGRSRMSDGVTGQLGGLVRTLLGQRGARWWSWWWWGSYPYFTPVTRSDCVGKRRWCSLCVRVGACVRMSVFASVHMSDSGIPAILVNHADRRLRIPPVHHDDYYHDVNAHTCAYILIHSRLTCNLYYLEGFQAKNRTHCWFTCRNAIWTIFGSHWFWTVDQRAEPSCWNQRDCCVAETPVCSNFRLKGERLTRIDHGSMSRYVGVVMQCSQRSMLSFDLCSSRKHLCLPRTTYLCYNDSGEV